MARSDIYTIIPLDKVARILGLSPQHFNGVYSDVDPDTNACDDMWFQYEWQSTGRISRDTLARVVATAERAVIQYLGFSPVPIWVQNEEHELSRPFRAEDSYIRATNARNRMQSITTNLGYFLSGGRRATSAIKENAAVKYIDCDNDGYTETAQVVVTTTVTDAEEIHVFFPDKSAQEIWEIRPVTVSLSGSTATITFPRSYVPNPVLWEEIPNDANRIAINGDTASNFLNIVDVYRVYNDPQSQLHFYTEGVCASCSGTGCESCTDTLETGCLSARNSRLGIVRFERADWDSTNEEFTSAAWENYRVAERARIWYRAGKTYDYSSRPHYEMDPVWERAIVYYALTFIDTELCGCANFKKIFEHQTEDLAEASRGKAFSATPYVLNNPLGTTRAARNLWTLITGPGGRLGRAR